MSVTFHFTLISAPAVHVSFMVNPDAVASKAEEVMVAAGVSAEDTMGVPKLPESVARQFAPTCIPFGPGYWKLNALA